MAKLLINIDVPDIERAVAFYTAAFELDVKRRLAPDVVELAGAEVGIFLLAKAEGSAPHAGGTRPRDYARHWTPIHLDVVVDDLEAALHRAERAGAKRETDIREYAWGRIALLADPFGHGFCLLQFKGRGYDEGV